MQLGKAIDLDVYPGGYVSVMGPSGSGKSTLFTMIGALDLQTAGAVTVGGISLADLSSRRKAFFRGRHLGYIFQAYNLIESMTARKNVALPLILGGTVKGEAMRRADAVLEEVGLGHRLDYRPDELSGGQQQRVAIARALMNNPAILSADEPTANLDLTAGLHIIEIIKDLSERRGVTVVTATHAHEMLRVSDRVVWIADGRIERVASRDEIHIEVGTVEQ